jgi:hypothetical protein
VAEQRFGAPLGAVHASLAAGLTEQQRATLVLALSFYTWRTLVREAGLGPAGAVELMTRSVLSA